MSSGIFASATAPTVVARRMDRGRASGQLCMRPCTGDDALANRQAVTVTLDTLGRPLRTLRVSVTDRCNLRCAYCMPEEHYVWLPREATLRFEEIEQLAGVFLELGVERIRLTGGEPLLRRDLPTLVARLAARPHLRDLALTTNGVLLEEYAPALKAAGLHRLTVSLDTLRRERFHALTRRDDLHRVLAGIDTAATLFHGLKIDSVVIRGVNDDEIGSLLAFARDCGAELRFIEYMDVGGATRWSADRVVTRAEVLVRLSESFGPIEPAPKDRSAPADRYRLPDGTVFGVISSTTLPFCADCDRSRLTADGVWYVCLYARHGVDLRTRLRAGTSAAEIKKLLRTTWERRLDRGAELRLAARDRAAFIPVDALRRDPHLEMHTRGG